MYRQPIGKALPYVPRRQFDDAVMFFRQFHLAFRTHHAIGFDAPDFANSDSRINAGDVSAGRRNHDDDSFARIGCTTYNLGRAVFGFDLADL